MNLPDPINGKSIFLNSALNTKKTVLMACSHPYWSCLQVGSQHLARQFSRHGYGVHYFSAPITPLHLARITSSEIRKRYRKAFQGVFIHPDEGIRSYIPFSLIAPDGVSILREPLVTSHWHKTIFPNLKRVFRHQGLTRVHLLYIDNLSYHFLTDYIGYDKCVFRVMDMHGHIPGWKGKTKPMAEKIAGKADLTIYSAKGLKSYVDGLSPKKTACIPNGVDFDFFHKKNSSAIRHPLLSNIPDPIVLYTGMIDSRLDFTLLKTAANNLPNISFVLVGPQEKRGRIPGLPDNLYLSGPVSHKELPHLMKSTKAGIIPFDIKNKGGFIRGIRPLKLMEFMAAGLPVICARWPEVENMNSPAWFYKSESEFVELVEKAVSIIHDQKTLLAFAKENSWNHAFNQMMKVML